MPVNRITGRVGSVFPLLGPDGKVHADNFEEITLIGPTPREQASQMLSPYDDYHEFDSPCDDPPIEVDHRLPMRYLLRTFVLGFALGFWLAMLLR